MFRPKSFFIILIFAFVFCSPASGATVNPAMEFASADGSILAILSCDIPAPYHTYAHTPGDAGRPTTLDVDVDGLGGMSVWYPGGFMQRDVYDSEATVYTWHGELTLFALLPEEAAGKHWQARLSMLLCSKRNCVPVRKTLSGKVPLHPQPLAQTAFQTQGLLAIAQLRAGITDFRDAATLEEGAAPPPINAREKMAGETGREEKEARKEPGGEQPLEALPPPDEFNLALAPQYAGQDLEVYSLGKALLFGLLAGLLLNAMPCVLPVLTFKISGLLLMAGVGDKVKIRKLREHNLCFAAGIMTLFSVLAVVLGMFDMMWGQLYQNHVFLLGILMLVFLMGLSMLGVFHLPALDLRMDAGSNNPRLSSYLTGLVSTFLATPCSGPLLGGVLAWAFTQPMIILMVVFWAVGLGMALPYLAICINPKLATILPRPGAWMLIFERILGFMLLGTALYLLSILPDSLRLKTLCALLGCSICAWIWGKTALGPVLRRRIVALVFIGAICVSFFWVLSPPEKAPAWRNFDAREFVAELGKKPMLVEFTADWCPNCKFMEASVLTSGNLAKMRAAYSPLLLRVDLTDDNPYGEKLLQMLGSKSIPLTALFPAGADAKKPLVLRDIYTAGTLFQAAAECFGAGDSRRQAGPAGHVAEGTY